MTHHRRLAIQLTLGAIVMLGLSWMAPTSATRHLDAAVNYTYHTLIPNIAKTGNP